MYTGVPTAVLGAMPSSALYFGTYEAVKTRLMRVAAERFPAGPAGGGGGSACTLHVIHTVRDQSLLYSGSHSLPPSPIPRPLPSTLTVAKSAPLFAPFTLFVIKTGCTPQGRRNSPALDLFPRRRRQHLCPSRRSHRLRSRLIELWRAFAAPLPDGGPQAYPSGAMAAVPARRS